VNLIYFIIFVCSKPLPTDPSKKNYSTRTFFICYPVAPSAGVTGSTALSAAEAWNFCRQTAEFLEGLKNRDADQQGNMFTPSLFLSFDLFGYLRPSLFAVLANDSKATQKALSDEKSAQLGVENSLSEEKALRQAAEQSLQQFKDVNATLTLELENAQTSLVATCDKLDSKLKVLYLQVFHADEAMLGLKNVESRLKAADDFLGGGPCCDAIQESSSWSELGAFTPELHCE
jgi:hypothetical protein